MMAVLVELFALRVLPVVSVFFGGRKLAKNKLQVIGLSYLVVLGFALAHQFSLRNLGLRTDFSWGGVLPYIIITLVFGLWFYAFASIAFTKTHVYPKEKAGVFWFLVSIPSQQLVYFGYSYALLASSIDDKFFIAITLGGLYGLVHIMWRNIYFLFGTLLLGLAWGFAYVNYPNVFLSTLSHLALAASIVAGYEKAGQKIKPFLYYR